mgnify:CR=1 FL=1|tara:strand:+ start:198 stop:401 length:204 start_codon:yes stop_codon:yes gene_type:complete
MQELIAKYDKKISLLDFDKETKKLIENFSSEINILIKVISKPECISVSIQENSNKDTPERVEWSFDF